MLWRSHVRPHNNSSPAKPSFHCDPHRPAYWAVSSHQLLFDAHNSDSKIVMRRQDAFALSYLRP